ncbi:glycosyl transferase family 2 [Bradyrhizobium sp. AC87j1]|uniref:glycosyltransferase n=1 Tax=Bradyrhizobium sp. AC87j1 TaxID=2055894 RepID=UPI000CEC246E|nr:glycosyltransferase [Bradyrhizobium sp. AC87j1]PPQ13809.1 glycosyl transferase family 2 [Bradyrhizobium sp. AC87j1]
MPPKVSIVVPAFNAADYIAETIDSLLAQDYPNLEIVTVDDGSTDQTCTILARYGGRIRLRHQANAGQSVALTAGWDMTDGSFIGYLSADDRLKPAAVRRCAEELDARPDVALVYPDFNVIDECSRLRFTVNSPDFSRRTLYGELHCLPGPGALFRRAAYEKAGPWRTDLRQIPDLDFFLRMALEGDFFHLSEELADFRMHAQSTTYRIVPFERGEEPLTVIESLFARPDLPADIRHWERSARANAELLSAAIHGRSGRAGVAIRHLVASFACPQAAFSRKTFSHVITITQGLFRGRS